jgi:hypothetical protein
MTERLGNFTLLSLLDTEVSYDLRVVIGILWAQRISFLDSPQTQLELAGPLSAALKDAGPSCYVRLSDGKAAKPLALRPRQYEGGSFHI